MNRADQVSTQQAKRHWPPRLPRQLVLPETSLWFNLEVSARRFPRKPATLYGGASLSYGELHAQAEALAGWWRSQGLQRGERIGLFMQNCPQFLVAFYAAMRADAVVVPINPMNKAEELAHLLSDSGARGLVFAADLGPVVQQALAGLSPPPVLLGLHYADALPPDGPAVEEGLPPALRDWLTSRPALPPGATPWPDALRSAPPAGPTLKGPDDLALLPYTSGTTGMPKGCMHTHRSLMANAYGGGLWGSASPEAVSLAVVPMFHITGLLYGVLSPVYYGSTLVLLPRWDRELAGRAISRHGVTHWTCVPTMIIDLFASPNYRSFDLSSLRYLSGGGTAMPQAVAQRLLDEFGLQFAEGYGLTETAAPTHANPPERAKLQCLGIPLFGVDSRVVVDPDTLQELPPGEVGEIISAGPMLFQGYWQQPEATAAAFVEIEGRRFFRTGDLGRMDEEGYFFLTDRLKRMINASGFKVWPSEVELLLFQHPGVQEACVIATRDAYRGESVKAVVVPRAEARGSLTEEALIAWARQHMAAYKVPRSVEFVDALPKSGAGKVMWRVLQARENESR